MRATVARPTVCWAVEGEDEYEADPKEVAEELRLKVWIKALRAPFFQAVVVPVLLGSAVAWHRQDVFHFGFFVLALLGAVFVNGGVNLTNDYFDHTSGADEINVEPTPFSGGSRVIQQGRVPPRAMFAGSLISFGLAVLVGAFLVYFRGWVLLLIGGFGIVTGYLYTAPPLRLGYRGWGELLAALNCGPLVVLAAYYVQTQQLDWEPLAASVPVGLLTGTILWINEFPDYGPDKAAGKANLVVRLGTARAVKGFYVLLVCIYGSIIAFCASGAIPLTCLLSLLTVPLAWKAARVARANHASGSAEKMIPAMACVIAMHLLTGVLLSVGYLTAGVFE